VLVSVEVPVSTSVTVSEAVVVAVLVVPPVDVLVSLPTTSPPVSVLVPPPVSAPPHPERTRKRERREEKTKRGQILKTRLFMILIPLRKRRGLFRPSAILDIPK